MRSRQTPLLHQASPLAVSDRRACRPSPRSPLSLCRASSALQARRSGHERYLHSLILPGYRRGQPRRALPSQRPRGPCAHLCLRPAESPSPPLPSPVKGPTKHLASLRRGCSLRQDSLRSCAPLRDLRLQQRARQSRLHFCHLRHRSLAPSGLFPLLLRLRCWTTSETSPHRRRRRGRAPLRRQLPFRRSLLLQGLAYLWLALPCQLHRHHPRRLGTTMTTNLATLLPSPLRRPSLQKRVGQCSLRDLRLPAHMRLCQRSWSKSSVYQGAGRRSARMTCRSSIGSKHLRARAHDATLPCCCRRVDRFPFIRTMRHLPGRWTDSMPCYPIR